MVIPRWLKPSPWADPVNIDEVSRQYLAADHEAPIFLREVVGWEARWQRMLFQVLIPPHLLVAHHIDPIKLTDPQDRPCAFIYTGADHSSFRLELFHAGDGSVPLAELEISDTAFNQIEVVWVTLQDPLAPRFDIDVIPEDQTTVRGTTRRNLSAEAAALEAGLAPGQTRRGLRILRELVERIETFMLCLNQREYIVQPLFYHTAVLFEQYGFSYMKGRSYMEMIHQRFMPGGDLRQQMNGATPFRQPQFADSIRGRSWAIHDQILDSPWDRVRMVKRVGQNASINTCPGIPW